MGRVPPSHRYSVGDGVPQCLRQGIGFSVHGFDCTFLLGRSSRKRCVCKITGFGLKIGKERLYDYEKISCIIFCGHAAGTLRLR